MNLVLPRVLVAAALAVAVDLALLAGARAAGASFLVPDWADPGALTRIGPVPVVLSTVVPLALGVGLTAAVARRRPKRARVLRVLAVVVTVLSLAMPLTVDTDLTTRTALALMHLVVGGAYLVATGPVTAPAPAPAPAPTAELDSQR